MDGAVKTASYFSGLLAIPSADPILRENVLPPLLICAKLWCRSRIDVDALRAVVQTRIFAIPRMRSVFHMRGHMVLQERGLLAMDLQYHVRVIPQVAPWNENDCDEYLARFYGSTLDIEHPQWQLQVFVLPALTPRHSKRRCR